MITQPKIQLKTKLEAHLISSYYKTIHHHLL